MIRTSLSWLFPLLFSSSLLGASFDKPFPADYQGKTGTWTSNHSSVGMELLDNKLTTVVSPYAMNSEYVTLDLTTLEIQTSRITNDSSQTKIENTYKSVDQGGDYLPYSSALNEMISVASRIDGDGNTEGPVTNVVNYLLALDAHMKDQAPESVDLYFLSSHLRQGTKHSFRVYYLVREDRDVLVEFFDAKWGYLTGTRVRAIAGQDSVKVELDVPVDAPTDQPGYIAAKIVPVDGTYTQKLAEVQKPVRFKKPYHIAEHSAGYANYSEPRVSLDVNHFCPELCEIRVDIFDAQGRFVISKTELADRPYMPGVSEKTYMRIDLAADLPAGQTYTYHVKLLPPGASWDKYLEQKSGTFVTMDWPKI